MLKIFGVCVLLVILAAVAIVGDLLYYSRPTWPAINDEARLISDTNLLISTHHTQVLPATEWPESIRRLRPFRVIIGENEFLEIVISPGGIGEPYSYIIFKSLTQKQTFEVSYRKLHPTRNPLIFRLW